MQDFITKDRAVKTNIVHLPIGGQVFWPSKLISWTPRSRNLKTIILLRANARDDQDTGKQARMTVAIATKGNWLFFREMERPGMEQQRSVAVRGHESLPAVLLTLNFTAVKCASSAWQTVKSTASLQFGQMNATTSIPLASNRITAPAAFLDKPPIASE